MANLSTRLHDARRRPVETGKSVVQQVKDDEVPFMAASIAYQAFVSLVPLLILLFVVVAFVGDASVARRVVRLTEGFLPNAAQSLLSDAIAQPGLPGGVTASVIGLVTLVWGSLKIFRGLDKAFSDIYETSGENSIVDQLKDGLIVLAVLGIAIISMVAVGSLFAVFDGLLLQALNLLLLVGGLTVAFLPMFKFFPDADLSWADAVPGAVFAAVGWTVLQFLFQLYVAYTSKGDASGALGAVLLLLLWLYLSGLVLLLGAVVNAVLLGEGEPSPMTDDEVAELAEERDELAEERDAYAEQYLEERDQRQTLEYEHERLAGELAAGEDEPLAAEVDALRAENGRLRRRLRWEERSLPARLVLRALGTEPPDPTDGDSTDEEWAAPARQRGERDAT